MAKKRKSRKAAKAKPARRRSSKAASSGEIDPLNIVAAVLVVILVGLGIYFYQANQKTASTTGSAAITLAAEKR